MKFRTQSGGWPAVAVLAAMALAIGASCGGGDSTASAYSTVELFGSDAGLIIFYKDAREQIIDSDAVVVGRAVDVAPAGSESGDESGPIEYFYNVIKVDTVLHQSAAVDVEAGDHLYVVNIIPNETSIETLRAAVDERALGVFSLFNASNLSDRLGEPVVQGPNEEWVLQTDASAVLEGPGSDQTLVVVRV